MSVDNLKNLPQTKFEITNFNEDYTLDCNNNDPLINADVLATLIRDLIEKGVINADGTVS